MTESESCYLHKNGKRYCLCLPDKHYDTTPQSLTMQKIQKLTTKLQLLIQKVEFC